MKRGFTGRAGKPEAAPAFQESKLGGPSWAERAYQDYGAYPME
jgi:hypothetical protein